MNSKGTLPYICMHPFSPRLPCHPGCHITLSSFHDLLGLYFTGELNSKPEQELDYRILHNKNYLPSNWNDANDI